MTPGARHDSMTSGNNPFVPPRIAHKIGAPRWKGIEVLPAIWLSFYMTAVRFFCDIAGLFYNFWTIGKTEVSFKPFIICLHMYYYTPEDETAVLSTYFSTGLKGFITHNGFVSNPT